MGKFIWFCQIPSMLLPLFLLSEADCSLSLSSSSLNSTPLCLSDDKSALLEFKNTMSIHDSDGDSTCYPKTNSWNESTNCCSWEGVTCDNATGQVIGLDLSCSLLVGSFTRNTTLFRLQGLEQLSLARNNFNFSSIPYGFNRLVGLTHLDLSGSYFSGFVPPDISFPSKLISLDLSQNDLAFDRRSFGMLTGNLSGIEYLFLDHVDMSSVEPKSFVNLSSSLKSLSFEFCDLQGEFPSEIFQLRNLEYFDVSFNSLTGHLPKSNWSSPLRLLDLSSNSFRGSVPASLGNLTKITSLDLSFNGFEGRIPDVFGNLNKLTALDFFDCSFSGLLPSSLFNLTQLTSLELSYNRLTGSLPKHVTGLQILNYLGLKDNLLTGGISSWIFTLPSLGILYLGNNSLTGRINPIQKPNSLRIVYLANNDIHGELPTSFFGLSKLTELDLSSNNLSGVIESDMLSKLESLERLDLSSNNFSGVFKLDVLSMMKNLTEVNLSNNKLLSCSSSDSGSGANSTFRVLEALYFSSCNVGHFPNFLRSSKSLRSVDLSNNRIQGRVLKWEAQGWEQLTYLNLSHNLLTGLEQFPGKNLQILDLRTNLLQGPLPAPPPSLQEFLISKNKLRGEIPPFICNLTSLVILDLSSNYFRGTIPACLGNFSYGISVINLQRNSLSSKIPDFCVEEDSLTTLALNDNRLEGLLPGSLVNCTSLRFLNVANNSLSDLFPHRLSVLPDLQVLILRSNGFYGCLDNSMPASGFFSLQVIDLSHNKLIGPLPTEFFTSLKAMKVVVSHQTIKCGVATPDVVCIPKCESCSADKYKTTTKLNMKRLELELDLEESLSTGFTLVDFSDNQFDGRIPEVLAELCSLLVLNLSHNSLTGPLPPSLGSVVALESLDLSSNKLGGRIPTELTKLTFLEVLNLSQNNFIGPIPVGNQFNTFDNDSYAGNLALCGFPLSKRCGNDEEPNPPTSKVGGDEVSAMAFIWKPVMMGYGCGVVLGLSTGYIVFTTGRPWWFVRMVERDWQRNFKRWIHRIGIKTN
ncbi:receptor like protein 6 [Hibiscus trionum]|uniref:Receptor like protein 6 n=1 Tax=Hibiscus trionum TaxID=183268 RepID=A0A9W7IZP4_HIBTR|nr:receptor like protein 6 [Hibiscus trionum]